MSAPVISAPVISTMILPDVANLHGGAFGGWLMSQCDLAAGLFGRRHAGACLTRSVQEMVFHAPARVGDAFLIEAELASEGRTSFVVNLTGLREDENGERQTVVTARFVMVCIDAEGRPRPIRAD